MQKLLLVLLVAAVLLLGCLGWQPQNPPLDRYPNGFPPYPENGSQPNEGGQGQPTAEPANAVKTEFLATASIVQYSKKSREKMQDSIVDAYQIVVGVANVSSGVGRDRPLSSPEKATVALSGPGGRFSLKQGEITQAEYDAIPNLMLWPAVPGYSDPAKTQFYISSAGSQMPGGVYTLTIDADGDGINDGEANITVPGVQIKNPKFASKQPASGFSIDWVQAGSTKDFIYTISTGKGFAGLDAYLANAESVPGTSLAATSDSIGHGRDIEPGNYMLNFQLEGAAQLNDMQDYYYGKSKKKMVFTFVTAKEAYLILYSVGDFCHCDDAFANTACTIDDILADPLCQ